MPQFTEKTSTPASNLNKKSFRAEHNIDFRLQLNRVVAIPTEIN